MKILIVFSKKFQNWEWNSRIFPGFPDSLPKLQVFQDVWEPWCCVSTRGGWLSHLAASAGRRCAWPLLDAPVLVRLVVRNKVAVAVFALFARAVLLLRFLLEKLLVTEHEVVICGENNCIITLPKCKTRTLWLRCFSQKRTHLHNGTDGFKLPLVLMSNMNEPWTRHSLI